MSHAEYNLSADALQQRIGELRREGYYESDDWYGLQEREYAVRSHGTDDMLSDEVLYDIKYE